MAANLVVGHCIAPERRASRSEAPPAYRASRNRTTSVFELIEIVVGLESIICWVEGTSGPLLPRPASAGLNRPPSSLRLICGHIDGGTTRRSPPPIRKGRLR